MKILTKQIKSILIASCAVVFTAYGQSIERQVLASSGNTISNSTVQLDFTLGETIVGDISNSNVILNQGFHQGTIQVAITINPVVYLQGPFSGSLMNDGLRSGGYLPTTSPYSDNLTCNSSVFNSGGTSGSGLASDNIVDWMWIELRDANDNTSVVASRSGLLQRDGNIVDIDGVSDLTFNAPNGDYFTVVNHRNHLGTMTQNTVSLSETVSVVDFTDANTPISYGSNPQKNFGNGILALWAGNVNGDNTVQYSGVSPDTPLILSEVLNDPGNFLNFSTYVSVGYKNTDLDLDGNTQYNGVNPDTPLILENVLAHPGNFLNFSTFAIQEQLPEN